MPRPSKNSGRSPANCRMVKGHPLWGTAHDSGCPPQSPGRTGRNSPSGGRSNSRSPHFRGAAPAALPRPLRVVQTYVHSASQLPCRSTAQLLQHPHQKGHRSHAVPASRRKPRRRRPRPQPGAVGPGPAPENGRGSPRHGTPSSKYGPIPGQSLKKLLQGPLLQRSPPRRERRVSAGRAQSAIRYSRSSFSTCSVGSRPSSSQREARAAPAHSARFLSDPSSAPRDGRGKRGGRAFRPGAYSLSRRGMTASSPRRRELPHGGKLISHRQPRRGDPQVLARRQVRLPRVAAIPCPNPGASSPGRFPGEGPVEPVGELLTGAAVNVTRPHLLRLQRAGTPSSRQTSGTPSGRRSRCGDPRRTQPGHGQHVTASSHSARPVRLRPAASRGSRNYPFLRRERRRSPCQYPPPRRQRLVGHSGTQDIGEKHFFRPTRGEVRGPLRWSSKTAAVRPSNPSGRGCAAAFPCRGFCVPAEKAENFLEVSRASAANHHSRGRRRPCQRRTCPEAGPAAGRRLRTRSSARIFSARLIQGRRIHRKIPPGARKSKSVHACRSTRASSSR